MLRGLSGAVDQVLLERRGSSKPLAVVLAGHNGSGKSTLWYHRLAGQLQIPLINADRMMLSVLPQVTDHEPLPQWAVNLRDHDESWMNVAQKGVEAFAAQAISFQVPFATRVNTRVAEGGHAVSAAKLEERFPRTQTAIRHAVPMADASILVDNSLDETKAFSVCRVQIRGKEVFDVRSGGASVPGSVLQWLNVVAPRVK
jgi:predicted ABC-type ATPase